jgi:spoIIIJ-associated protein
MSPCFEFEDRTVEKALKKACAKLNVSKEELRHDVISYGSTGIFGLVGTKKARIRVTVPDSALTQLPEKSVSKPEIETEPQSHKQVDVVKKAAAADECVSLPDSDDPRAVGTDALERILDAITSDAQVQVEERSGRILFNIKGGNTGVLIGKRGQTLEAIQYLVEKIVNRGRDERVRVQVDVEGYLQNRRVNLQKSARRMAEKVQRTGKPATIGQMNANDRRIVHIALKDNTSVRTQSLGDGYLRKLVIFPKKNSTRGRKSDG